MVLRLPQTPLLSDVRTALRSALTEKYGEREASAMARIILTKLKNWDFTTLLANETREASEYIVNRCDEILKQLLSDVPIQYALGETTFYGLSLAVRPGVLIPRPETEELVDIIVKENQIPDLRVLDICTGSGAIALALARNLPFSKIDALDISEDAVAIANENAKRLKTDIEIVQGDVFDYIFPDNEYDVIVSNPPYVDESEKVQMERNVVDYEPAIALFVPDENPLVFYKRIAEIGRTALKDGGKLYLEINPRHSAELKALLERSGYRDIELLRDVHGKCRFAEARL